MAFNGVSKNIDKLLEAAFASPSPKNGARMLEQLRRSEDSYPDRCVICFNPTENPNTDGICASCIEGDLKLLLCKNCGQPVDILVPEGLVHVSPAITCEKAAL